MAEIDISNIHAFIGQVEIEKRKENLKKNRENMKNDILQVNHVDLQILNDLLVKQSLQHQITQQAAVKIQRNLSVVHEKVFSFELNANIEPPKFVIALLDLHAQYKDQQNPVTPTRK
jgi:hypothetical protein